MRNRLPLWLAGTLAGGAIALGISSVMSVRGLKSAFKTADFQDLVDWHGDYSISIYEQGLITTKQKDELVGVLYGEEDDDDASNAQCGIDVPGSWVQEMKQKHPTARPCEIANWFRFKREYGQ